MFTPQFNQDGEAAGGVATEAAENPAAVAEATDTNQEQPNPETEEGAFADFGEDEPTTDEAPAGGAVSNDPAKTVPESEYEKVKADLTKVSDELNQLKAQLQNPLVVAALKYSEAQEAGVELNAVDFIHKTFGIDAQRLSDEDVLKETIRKEAAMVNLTLSDEELDSEFESRWSEIQSKGAVGSKVEIKKMRESLGKDSGGELQSIIEQKKAEQKKAQEFIQTQVQNVEAELKSIIEAGKKPWGLKVQVDENLEKQLRLVMENNFIRFAKDGNIDVQHYIETALFALNPKAYVKKIEESASKKADLKGLANRSAGSLTNPTTIPGEQLTNRKLGDQKFEAGAWDPKNATAIKV